MSETHTGTKYVVFSASSPQNKTGYAVDRIFDTEADAMKYIESLKGSCTSIVRVVVPGDTVVIIPPDAATLLTTQPKSHAV